MTNKQYRLLKYIYKKPRNASWIKNKFHLSDSSFNMLIKGDDDFYQYYLPELKEDSDDIMHINNLGISYVDMRRGDSIRFWIPTSLSVIAIVLSIISLVLHC